MWTVEAEASGEIGAAADLVYDIIADYEVGHPAILPRRHFTGLEVERGGRGAGTVIRFGMKAMGRVQQARAEIAEPEPGRMLAETTLDGRAILTTFTVDALDERHSRVTIRSRWSGRGVSGLVERILAPRMLRRVYAAELAQLDRVARERLARGMPR